MKIHLTSVRMTVTKRPEINQPQMLVMMQRNGNTPLVRIYNSTAITEHSEV